MDQLPLRVPDHGPYVENGDGGRATPGEGFPIRAVYSIEQFPGDGIGAGSSGPDTEAHTPALVMPAASARLRYEVSLHYALELGTWSAVGALQFDIQARRSGGNWSNFTSMIMDLDDVASGNNWIDGVLQVVVDGGSVPSFVEGEDMEFRGRVGISGGGTDGGAEFAASNNNGNLKVLEML